MDVDKLKKEYALSKGFENWHHLFITDCYEPLDMEKHYDEMYKSIINKQNELLKDIYENECVHGDTYDKLESLINEIN